LCKKNQTQGTSKLKGGFAALQIWRHMTFTHGSQKVAGERLATQTDSTTKDARWMRENPESGFSLIHVPWV
jgi:hypothetical protein